MQTNRKWRRIFPVQLALLLLLSAPLWAQTFRGTINGVVTDPSGAVVPGAKVTATDVATAAVRTTISSGAGEFAFSDLPASSYNIKVEATGFQATDVTGVQLLAGKVYTLPVKLSVAQQAATVEVSADALSLDTTTVTQTTTLASTALQDVPLNGRDFTQLLGTSPAFAGYNNSGSVNGTRNDQINYTIDGTDNNDLYLQVDAVNQGGISGIAGVVYPMDALDEYSLQTTGNSESGRSPGGNLNITTKSGTNQVHGTAYYYNRNEALAVLSPFVTPGSPEQPLRNQNYGGSVGGPFWRDKSFFFLTYEEQKFVIGEPNTVTEPSPAYQALALAELTNTASRPARSQRTFSARCGIRRTLQAFLRSQATTPVPRLRRATATTLSYTSTRTSVIKTTSRNVGTSARATPTLPVVSLSAPTCRSTSRLFPRISRTSTSSGITTSAPASATRSLPASATLCRTLQMRSTTRIP